MNDETLEAVAVSCDGVSDEMPLLKNDKDRQRFYLLPGMGGPAYRRKQKLILKCSLAAGILISVIVAVVIYLLNRSPG